MTELGKYEKRWFMLDFARMRSFERSEIDLLLDLLKRAGYNGLGLYVEGAFEMPGTRGLPRKGCLTCEDVEYLKAACAARDFYLFPLTNTVYHMEHYLTQERYALLRDTGPHERYQLRFNDPAAKPFLMERLHALRDLFGTDFIHIGGDEAVLPPERKPEYAAFVGDLCRTLIDEGVTPAVWGDMFWGKQELAPYLPRETVIFDWYYGGHRPESLRFFREQGFADVLPCPCDDGWTHFINVQRCGSKDPRPVEGGEIEALLADGLEAGCTGACVTHWEDINGHNLWANLLPIIRAGLFMDGRYDVSRPEGEQVEQLLFGRTTPYTEITHVLRELTTPQTINYCPWHVPSHAVFYDGLSMYILCRPQGFWAACLRDYPQALAAVRPLLDAWQPEGAVEDHAKRAMEAVIAAVEASLSMMRLSNSHDLWHEAALAQFEDGQYDPRGVFRKNLITLLGRIEETRAAHRRAAEAYLLGTVGTGISDQPVRFQNQLIAILDGLYDRVYAYLQDPALRDVAIPAWYELVTDWEFTKGGLVG